MTVSVFIIGEDELCCSIGEALIIQSGAQAKIEHSQATGGFGKFKEKIPQMNTIAKNIMPVLMLADGDQDICVVQQRNDWMPKHPSDKFSLRLAVRESESWLLADRDGFSRFAEISQDLIPRTPDTTQNPKELLLQLIKKSRKRQLRNEMLPSKGSRSKIGLGYNIHLRDFITNYWSADRAAINSPSLARSIPRIATLLAL